MSEETNPDNTPDNVPAELPEETLPPLTKAQVRDAFPPNMKTAVSDHLVDTLNKISSDPEEARVFRDNFISYVSVLSTGRFKMDDYLAAVKYVSYKLMGLTNEEAFIKTHPDRYQRLMARGTDKKTLSSYVAAYNKNKLVNAIYEQTMIPTWVLNQDAFQRAINTQLELMADDDVSPLVRMQAANSIMTHLKQPETKNLDVAITVKGDDGMKALKEQMEELAWRQQELIEQGAKTADIAALPLHAKTANIEDGEYQEVE